MAVAAPDPATPPAAARVGGVGALDLPDGGLLGAIVRLNLAVTEVLEGVAGRAGLTFADYLVLGVIRRSPDQRSAPTAIAGVLGRTTGGMSLALDRLEVAGLVRRTPDPTDGRRVVVALTAAGTRLATTVNAALHQWEDSLPLDRPRSGTVDLLDHLTAAVTAHPA
jgi:DNA-binding MarR family transcriptional regulator